MGAVVEEMEFGSGDVRCPVRSWIAYIHEHAILPIELFLGFVNLDLRNSIHSLPP
jgi:hypothetical protein